MNIKNDGGPAFPTFKSIDSDETQRNGISVRDINGIEGMSLRDWFAGMALSNTSDQRVESVKTFLKENKIYTTHEIIKADLAYYQADKLLSRRGEIGIFEKLDLESVAKK